jgi:hypothetical protein
MRWLAPSAAPGPSPTTITVGEEGEHRRMLFLDGPRHHDGSHARRGANPRFVALTPTSR